MGKKAEGRKLKSIDSNNKLLPEKVSEQIVQLISDRKLKAGEKLPNEFEMAEQLNVGRGTIREAIKILVSRNVVEIKRGRGTFVCETPGLMDDPLGFTFIKDKSTLALDICEVRMMIEPEIAALAALRATREQVEKIEEYANEVEALFKQGKPYLKMDILFHAEIARATGNQVTTNLLPVIQSGISLFIDVTDYSIANKTIVTHREILEAIKRHDSEGAREAMKRHLENNRVQINELMKKME